MVELYYLSARSDVERSSDLFEGNNCVTGELKLDRTIVTLIYSLVCEVDDLTRGDNALFNNC